MIAAFLVSLLRAALLLLPLLPTLMAPLKEAAQDEFSLRDEMALFHDVCFAAAANYTEHPTTLRSAASLQQFHSQLAARCKRPVSEPEFDFTSGRILFGLWSPGAGCGARHILTHYERDAAAGRITVRARLVTFGNCPYELLRPLWLSVPADPEVRIDLRVALP